MNDHTPDRDPVEELLEDAGTTPVPLPDPMFVARLETDLRIAHVAARPVRRGIWLVTGGALLGAAAVVVLFVLFSGSSRTGVDLDEGVAGQPNTPVVTVVPPPDEDGPDPTDGEEDDADRVDGRDEDVVADDSGTPSTTAPPPADSAEPGSDDERPVTGPSTTRPPTTEPSSSPGSTRPEATTTTTSSGSSSTTGSTSSTTVPTTTTTTTPSDTRPPAKRLDLAARQVDDRTVGVAWSSYEGDDFAMWRVVRRNADGTGAAVIHTSRARADRRASDRPQDRDVAYRVVALDGDGRVVAESGWVRLARRPPDEAKAESVDERDTRPAVRDDSKSEPAREGSP